MKGDLAHVALLFLEGKKLQAKVSHLDVLWHFLLWHIMKCVNK